VHQHAGRLVCAAILRCRCAVALGLPGGSQALGRGGDFETGEAALPSAKLYISSLCISSSDMVLTDLFCTIAAVAMEMTVDLFWQTGMLPFRMMWRCAEQRLRPAVDAVGAFVHLAMHGVSPGCPQRCGASFSPPESQGQQL